MTEVVINTEAIDAILAPFVSDSEPGLAVGIALHGEPVYRRGFGVASVEVAAPLTSGTRMRIGSVSKHFAALALMLLVEERLVTLDDGIRRYVPELPRHADPVTLRHLLQHTSGLRCGFDILMSMAGIGMPMPADAPVDILTQQEAPQFVPGGSWNYNNSGYALIGLVIEKISDRPLAEFLRDRLFQPLGMVNTLLRSLDTDLVPNCATLHVPSAKGRWVRGVFGPPLGAEGGIVSSIDDMLLWLANMRRPTLGSAKTWATMRRPAVLDNGHETGYGFGLSVGEWRGHRIVQHAGGVIGGSAQMLSLDQLGLDLILIANRGAIDVRQIANDVLDACVATEAVSAADPPQIQAEGVFRSSRTDMVIELGAHEGRQTLCVMGAQIPARLRADGAIALDVDVGVAIRTPVGEREPATIDYVGLGGCETLERVSPPTRTDASLIGEYASAEAQAEARVTGVSDELKLETRSRYGTMSYQLRAIGPKLWSLTPRGAPVPFGGILECDAAGFRFSTRRARRLRFERKN